MNRLKNNNYEILVFLLIVLQLNNSIATFYNENDEKYCSNKLLCGKDTFINKPNEFDRLKELKPKKKAICEACELAVPVIQKLIVENKTEHFQSIVTFFCTEFKIEDDVVCDLVVKQYEASFIEKTDLFYY
jgi:hypothetical protein